MGGKVCVEPQYGIIGFYDILGYKSFLKNNSVETVAEDINKVLHLISNIDTYITKQTLRIFNKTNTKIAKRLLKEMKWFIFSDTIIQISIFQKDEKTDEYNKWLIFLIASLCLNRLMFKYGLPLRGAISIGSFLFENSCFAGKPCLETYELANKLDLSACVITDKAHKEVENLINSCKYPNVKKLFNVLFVKYQIPIKENNTSLKNQKNQKVCLYSLNLLTPKALKQSTIKNNIDIYKYVLNKFKKHKKSVPGKVKSKVKNTKQFLQHLVNFVINNKLN